MASWDLSARQLCDLELLLNGAFAPLSGFMGQADYDSVLATMRLACGALWPIPITLEVDAGFADTLVLGQDIALRDPEGVIIALLKLESKWTPDKAQEARLVYDTEDRAHPAVAYLHAACSASQPCHGVCCAPCPNRPGHSAVWTSHRFCELPW